MPSTPGEGGRAPTKAQFQRRMDEARASISDTVEEIKDRVGDQYETVKRTVSDVLDWREQLPKDPVAWSIGALSAGFALGYTLGYAHTKSARGNHPEVAAFTDSIVDEVSKVSKSLMMPSLDAHLKRLFGFDLGQLLDEIAEARTARGRKRAKRTRPRRGARSRRVRRGPPGAIELTLRVEADIEALTRRALSRPGASHRAAVVGPRGDARHSRERRSVALFKVEANRLVTECNGPSARAPAAPRRSRAGALRPTHRGNAARATGP